MCKRVICPTCNKPGWVGCGAHVEEILSDVAEADRCQCQSPPEPSGGFLSRIFRT